MQLRKPPPRLREGPPLQQHHLLPRDGRSPSATGATRSTLQRRCSVRPCDRTCSSSCGKPRRPAGLQALHDLAAAQVGGYQQHVMRLLLSDGVRAIQVPTACSRANALNLHCIDDRFRTACSAEAQGRFTRRRSAQQTRQSGECSKIARSRTHFLLTCLLELQQVLQ